MIKIVDIASVSGRGGGEGRVVDVSSSHYKQVMDNFPPADCDIHRVGCLRAQTRNDGFNEVYEGI